MQKGKDDNNGGRTPSPMKERKARLCTTLSSAPYVPHLTKTELRKQLFRLKFPIVVLGREELTSAYYVMNDEFSPQFEGLDTMSWPFMKEWRDIKENTKFEIHKDIPQPKSDLKIKPKNSPKCKTDPVTNGDVESYNDTNKPKREISSYSRQQSRKSICNLKDKVLAILSKKSSLIKSNIQSLTNKVRSDNNTKLIVGEVRESNINDAVAQCIQNIPAKLPICNVEVPLRIQSHRSPPLSTVKGKALWCNKALGCNEFINNVIQKVSAGVYYTQDNKSLQSSG